MRFTADNIDDLKTELERAFNAPDKPYPVYSCTTADMPPAADHPRSVLFNTTLNVLAYSDGTAWYRTDTASPI